MNDLDGNEAIRLEMPDFDRSLPMLLIGALDACMPAYRAIFAANDLTEQQWRVLRVLWFAAELSHVQIARRTYISKSSLVGILDRLVARGLVVRWRDERDRRLVRARLTQQGIAQRDAVMPGLIEINEEITNRLSPKQWEQLIDLLTLASGRKWRE